MGTYEVVLGCIKVGDFCVIAREGDIKATFFLLNQLRLSHQFLTERSTSLGKIEEDAALWFCFRSASRTRHSAFPSLPAIFVGWLSVGPHVI